MNMFQRLLFNLWYLGRPPWDRGVSPPELIEYIGSHPAARAVDIGCGTGTNTITLTKAGWQVTGVDFAVLAIWLALRKVRTAGVQADLYVRDVTHLSGIQGPYDLALDIGCFHGVAHKAAYLSELCRILAPKGSWLLYAFFRPPSAQADPGLTEEDLRLVARHMQLIWRRDGSDRRGRPSAWFHYQKI
jgi:ubiquinone/menaquinone biosynthesis C-methylase UbiE